MPKNSFAMYVQKQGRMKYLLLTVCPTLALMYLFQFLATWGILPGGSTWGLIYVIISMTLMLILGYFLVFQKNHQLRIDGNTIVETNWRGHESCRIRSSQIHSIRRNFLKEIILLNQSGSKLLCVESNMSNFDRFEQWLVSHNIH